MSFLELNGTRHSIPTGESAIGTDPASFIPLEGNGITTRHLLITGTEDGQASVSRADEAAEIRINGVRLGPQPTPLLHGDKIAIGDHELLFVDERRSGSTQFIRAEDLAALQKPPSDRRPAGSGTPAQGRLVSLTDGREYQISGAPLVFGRDAGCDVVVTSKKVSRRHAEILFTQNGYMLVDASTNGTFVNGQRVIGEFRLSRGDVLKVGEDEFRFYVETDEPRSAAPPTGAPQRLADTMHGIPPAPGAPPPPPDLAPPPPSDLASSPRPEPAPSPPARAPAGAQQRLNETMHGIPAAERPRAPGPPPSRPAAPAGAQQRLKDTMHGVPAARRPPSTTAGGGTGSVLANMIGRSGSFRGERFVIRVPVVNVGRAGYNDIVINDTTVSTIHAKVQRREGVWILQDLESTNGTFVDGSRVEDESPIAPGAIIRFGDVSLVFEPVDDTIEPQGGGTRMMGALDGPVSPPAGDSPNTGGRDEGANPDGGPSTPPTPPQDNERQGFRLWPFK